MTPDDAPPTAAAKTTPGGGSAKFHSHRSHITRIAKQIADADFGTGPLAELRRKDPEAVASTPAFHRLTAHMEDVSWAGDALRWATVIQAMAIGTSPGDALPSESVGSALAYAGYPESRFARLLASRGNSFRGQIVLLARYMNAKKVRFDWRPLGELMLVEGLPAQKERAEELRFNIARDYYRALEKKQKDAAA